MKTYKEFRPTSFDHHIEIEDRENWLLVPVSQTRDSGCLARSNFETAVKMLGGESEDVEIHRFGHWGPGWIEVIIVNPDNNGLVLVATEIEASLESYPVLDDEDFSQKENDEANEVWMNYYNEKERVEYIRRNRSQFDFRDFADMVRSVRGEYFAGYASELIG